MKSYKNYVLITPFLYFHATCLPNHVSFIEDESLNIWKVFVQKDVSPYHNESKMIVFFMCSLLMIVIIVIKY